MFLNWDILIIIMETAKKIVRKYSKFVQLLAAAILLIFLFFGLILTLATINNIRYRFSLTNGLFLFIGVYLMYDISKYLFSLYKNRKNFKKTLIKFFEEKETAIYVTSIVSIILLFIFYFTAIHLKLNFFVNIALYLLIFVLNNLTFMVTIFLKSSNLGFLNFLINSILPISEILYVYKIVGFFFRKKKSFK